MIRSPSPAAPVPGAPARRGQRDQAQRVVVLGLVDKRHLGEIDLGRQLDKDRLARRVVEAVQAYAGVCPHDSVGSSPSATLEVGYAGQKPRHLPVPRLDRQVLSRHARLFVHAPSPQRLRHLYRVRVITDARQRRRLSLRVACLAWPRRPYYTRNKRGSASAQLGDQHLEGRQAQLIERERAGGRGRGSRAAGAGCAPPSARLEPLRRA